MKKFTVLCIGSVGLQCVMVLFSAASAATVVSYLKNIIHKVTHIHAVYLQQVADTVICSEAACTSVELVDFPNMANCKLLVLLLHGCCSASVVSTYDVRVEEAETTRCSSGQNCPEKPANDKTVFQSWQKYWD